MKHVIITAPSLDPTQNVSGVSSVVQFIIDNNKECKYQHFELGKKDKEKRGLANVKRLIGSYKEWKKVVNANLDHDGNRNDAIVHYSFPLNTPSILRDPVFMHYALKQGMKMVVHIHGGLFLTAPRIPFPLKKILKWVFSWNVPFVVLSDMEKDILMNKFGAKKVDILPNCVDLRDAKEYAKGRGDRLGVGGDRLEVGGDRLEAGGDKRQPLVLGYLGRIEPLKGMSELLTACKRLQNDGVRFKLVLAGKEKKENEYLPLFQNELKDNFEYVGLVSGKTKCEFLRSLDVFVMPSYFEGLPMSLLETMSYGLVPVITPVGSVPTVVNNDNGLFVKVRDVDSIVEAIKLLDGDRDMLMRLGDNARKTIFKNFSTEVYVKKLNEIYESTDISK